MFSGYFCSYIAVTNTAALANSLYLFSRRDKSYLAALRIEIAWNLLATGLRQRRVCRFYEREQRPKMQDCA
jgi:hypothetical protein